MRSIVVLLSGALSVACGSSRVVATLPQVEQPSAGHAHLIGTVTDDREHTLGHARVILRRYLEGDIVGVVDTQLADQSGGFGFWNVPPGRYVIDAEFVGLRTTRYAVILEPGAIDTARVRMPYVPVRLSH